MMAKNTKYIQIMRSIIDGIQKGRLLPGTKLPPERKMAIDFSVNRSTVVRALEELQSLGIVRRKQGSGTYITETAAQQQADYVDWRQYLQREWTTEGQQQLEQLSQQPGMLDLYTGELPRELIPSFRFPSFDWQEILAAESLQDHRGYQPLIETVQHHLQKNFSLQVDTSEIMITSGAQQAIFLILQTMLDPGDVVAVETPSFLTALPIFHHSGIQTQGISMDDEGIDLAKLEQAILQQKVRMIMVNPNFQNPTGKTMSLARRKGLVALARQYQLPILEDDVFGELAFDQLLPSLKKLDPENVLYTGSMSKILGSSIKVGWLVAPTIIAEKLASARQMMDFSMSIFPQVLTNIALTDPAYARKMAALRLTLSERAEQMMTLFALQRDWQVDPVNGGYYLWAEHSQLDAQHIQQLLQAGLLSAPAELFGSNQRAIRLNFARFSPQDHERFYTIISTLKT